MGKIEDLQNQINDLEMQLNYEGNTPERENYIRAEIGRLKSELEIEQERKRQEKNEHDILQQEENQMCLDEEDCEYEEEEELEL